MRKVLFLFPLLFIGCGNKKDLFPKPAETKHSVKAGWIMLYMAEIDGHEYIVNEVGGVCHHYGCPCLEKAEKP